MSKMRRLKIAIALLVGVSSGLVAIRGEASLPLVGAAVVAGTVVGAALAWYVFPDGSAYR